MNHIGTTVSETVSLLTEAAALQRKHTELESRVEHMGLAIRENLAEIERLKKANTCLTASLKCERDINAKLKARIKSAQVALSDV